MRYTSLAKAVGDLKCPRCRGLGKCNDSEPGDIGYNEWICPDCGGNGWKDGQEMVLSMLPNKHAPKKIRRRVG